MPGLADIISPARTPRSSGAPIPSRPPSIPSDSTNPHLFPTKNQVPSHRRTNEGSGQTSRLEQFVHRHLPNQPDRHRKIAETRSNNSRRGAIENQMTRIWHTGDVYAPHDLSSVEMVKARLARMPARSRGRNAGALNSRRKGSKDVVDALGINPVAEYKNVAMMGEYVSGMGRIRHGRETGLRAVNQRKMAKAIRRSIGIGLLPSVHRHPELHPDRLNLRGQASSGKPFNA